MDTIVYWLLVISYWFLGLIAGMIVIALLYPPLRTFPMTAMLIWAGTLKRSALFNLIWAIFFPIILLGIGYFFLNLLTPALDVIKSTSFLVGFLGVFLITLFDGGFRRINLNADYADFMKRHSNLPSGASDLHVLIATQVIKCSLTNHDNPKFKEEWDFMYELMRKLEFNEDDEDLLIQTMINLKATDNEIQLAQGVYSDEREYVEGIRQLERDRLEWEREEEELAARQREEDEEFDRQMKEWKEGEDL
jgi:hypothetical protein